ncbi:putative bifunctional diguanylate cyclase/phosphodiesterase [Denitromonas sp.]|uniref:putative bifunctional diguanylate cyclase/phosphodiesterase n=1 Tax=Denitromonas sp. TaxID=2734609 RepID=UPI002AFFB9DD|nr:EAL domain-containing protein [Denitromonas sp.]
MEAASHELATRTPRVIRHLRRLVKHFGLAIALAGVLAAATETVYKSALDAQRDRVYAEFQLAAGQHIGTLRKRLDAVLDLQRLLSDHVDVAGAGTASDFEQISGSLMRVHTFIKAIALADIDDSTTPPLRFPARHVSTHATWPRPGTDLAMEGLVAQESLQAALRTGQIVATPLLSPEAENGEGIRLFSPAGDHLLGIYMHLSELAQSTLWAGMDPDARNMAFTILDATDDPRTAPEVYRDTIGDNFETAYVEAIAFGARRWLVIATPTPNHFELAPSASIARQRATGWAITVLAALLVAFLQTRNSVIRERVRSSTAELAATNRILADTNATLQAEVAQRTASEAALRASTVLQQAILHSADYAIVLTDTDGIVRVFNPAAENMLGCTADMVIGQRTPIDFINREAMARMQAATGKRGFAAVLETARGLSSSEPVELELTRPDGRNVPAAVSISPLMDAQDGRITGYLAIASDITHRKAAETRILHLAHFDPLTDLPNRSLLGIRLESALEAAGRFDQSLAVLFLDLDRFKNVNDSLGHQAGDALLKAVSGRFQHCVREQDTVARMGGDEFIVVLPELESRRQAAEVAERIIEALGAPFDIKGHRLTVTPSIGIAIYPDDGSTADTLIQHADAAMYHAKDAGRNNFQFYESRLSTLVSARLTLENRLRRALERNEFELYYQPQVDIASGSFIGVEAMLRWRDPDEGLVDPAEFIPIAEDSGLIVPIGAWVLRTACAQAQAWRRNHLIDVPIAVNLSARQFDESGLLDSVADILQDTGLPANRLELELTESLIMRNPELTAEVLDAAKALGVMIGVDDFGTGYSSLAYLKRFPIDRLKIDRSFIADIESEPDDAAIAETIIAMAHTLRIQVLAEGVETAGQLRMLRGWACDAYQGYLCSHPLPAADMDALLRGLRAVRVYGLPDVGHA